MVVRSLAHEVDPEALVRPAQRLVGLGLGLGLGLGVGVGVGEGLAQRLGADRGELIAQLRRDLVRLA